MYRADRYFQGGQTQTITNAITSTSEAALFQSERYGTFSYSIPVTPASYTVKLQLAELYWTAVNMRSFSITIEGVPVISALDIVASVGARTAMSKIFENIPVTDSVLNIDVGGEIDNGTLTGLVVYWFI